MTERVIVLTKTKFLILVISVILVLCLFIIGNIFLFFTFVDSNEESDVCSKDEAKKNDNIKWWNEKGNQNCCVNNRTDINTQFRNCGGDRVSGLPFATRSEVLGQNGIAATSHPLVTQIAIDILKKGGNAVDAAIAANAAQGLMEPTGNGIGGDIFAIVWKPLSDDNEKGEIYGLNGSGAASMNLSYDELVEKMGDLKYIPEYGPLSVTVPGCVSGWFSLHEKFGTMDMKDLLKPAIEYARNGFPLTQTIASSWASGLKSRLENLDDITSNGDYPNAFDNFLKVYTKNGVPYKEGEIFKNPDLADSLQAIADGGRDAFYNGLLTDIMDKYSPTVGLALSKEDFNLHQSEWIDPVSTTYRNIYEVYELPPNPQGIAALQQLNILEGYNLTALGFNSAEYLHLHIESKKLAYADRAVYYADPNFADVPVKGLISKEYAAERRKLIKNDTSLNTVDAGNPYLYQGDTIYLTTADKQGMMVSLIQSNYYGFGSSLVPGNSTNTLGFNYQDRGALFAVYPKTHANVYQPGKRPFHTIMPAFVTKNGKPFMSFGVMGGAMQPMGHVQILCNVIDFGMNIQEAGDAARYYHESVTSPTNGDIVMTDGGVAYLESGICPTVRDELVKKGHIIGGASQASFGGYQGIKYDSVNKVYHGASEKRKDGQAQAY